MIIGIGTDLVDIRRIQAAIDRYGDRFINRIFTPSEQEYARSCEASAKVYANRFAAKEAAVKALGTGMAQGVSWQDIEVVRAPSGAPSLQFHGKALEHLQARLPADYTPQVFVSFSDEPPYSTAFVVIEGVPQGHPIERG